MDMINHYNFRMIRGDTLSFGLEFENLDQDLEGAYFTCRESYDGAIVFQKTLGDGIEKVETGVYRVRVAPADTKAIDAGKYCYDVEVDVNNDVITVLEGILDIKHDVTY